MKKCLIFLIICFYTKQTYAQEIFNESELNIELVSTELNTFQNARDFSTSPNEDEIYFTIQSPRQEISQIVCVKDKKWDDPTILPFCDNYSYLEPFLSNDGKRLYFASDRPKNKLDTLKSDFDIWYVERKSITSKWSNPINLGSSVNSKNNEFYPTLADNNNLYFTMESELGLGKDDIYYCKWNGTDYSKPILLSSNINSEGYEFNAFISKDENMLIYTKYNTKDGFGSGDLYVSKKDKNGEWLASENLGNKINTKFMEYCPFYNDQTNTLYFTSNRSKLVPKTFKSIQEFQEYVTSNENGQSKIYKYKITF
jgi:hypothetical protein